jgi:hypothetical protein
MGKLSELHVCLKTALRFYQGLVSAKGENVALLLSSEAYANWIHSDSSGRMTPAGAVSLGHGGTERIWYVRGAAWECKSMLCMVTVAMSVN